MMRKGIGALLLLGLLAGGLAAMDDAAAPATKAGYALLDSYVKSFQEMATGGTSGQDLENRLQAMAAEAKKALAAAEITLTFSARYGRILAVTKLIAAPDKGDILVPVINRELTDFIWTVTGEDAAAWYKAGGPGAVGMVANAIAEEIVNLQIYLDTLNKREAIRKKLDEGISKAAK